MDPLSAGLIGWCALFAAIGAAGTWMARAYALQRQLVDQPGERRSHRVATPRGGGIAIALAFLIALVAMILREPREIVLLACAGFGLLLVAGIGWMDDHRPLSPWLRLTVHAVAAGWLGVGFYLSGASGAVAITTFASALVLVNIWNFMDGIDGLAATQAVLAAAAFVFLTGSLLAIHLGLALIASTLAFLPFNFPRASIFLGDVGSGALGFALALMLGMSLDAMPLQAWPLVFLPLSAFLLDAGLTLSMRMLRGERWWMPHVEHAYQRWARCTGRHPPVTAGYAVWTLLMCVGMVLLWKRNPRGMEMVVLVCLAIGCGFWYGLRRYATADDVNRETGA
ncbi:MAG: glycosyltransferase family 4 protein [Lysobacter sp.]|nr:glycosyltransferase family 4 protein [Lysobacter sp.]